jgi:ketosteroid isomerase-like protein
MGADENREIIRRGYEAFNAADMATLTEIFDEGVQWHSPGRGAMAGDYDGRDATFGYFGRLGQETGGDFNAELQTLTADGDLVAGRHRSRGSRDGASLDVGVAIFFRLDGGKIVEAHEYYDDLYAWDDFWG